MRYIYIKEKKLTKHVCQPGKSSPQTSKVRFFWQYLHLVNLIVNMTSLMSSNVKISCSHSKINPCKSLKFI